VACHRRSRRASAQPSLASGFSTSLFNVVELQSTAKHVAVMIAASWSSMVALPK
jgi:hypothetical protein